MKANRLEAFSDGVIAIIITIMVLELKAPHEPTVAALLALWPVLLSYVLSFITVGIYWINHHHLLHLSQRVDRRTLWANMHLLFWLSLVPFATAYMGESKATPLSVAMYAGLMTICSSTWWLLAGHATQHLASEGEPSSLARARTRKVALAIALNAAAVPIAYLNVPLSLVLIITPLAIYFLPEKATDSSEVRA